MMVYFSHEFGGNQKNMEKIENHIKNIVQRYDDKIMPVSPINCTGFLYDYVSYEIGIDWCLKFLSMCDIMIVFGNCSNSRGCLIEKEYCNKNNIPIVEYSDFDSWYEKHNGGDINV
jgi:hypothetical protein